MRASWARKWTPGDRVRVVFLTGLLGYGGSERQVYLGLTHLDDTLFERHVVVFNQGVHRECAEELEAAGVKVWRVPADCRGIFSRLRFLTRLLMDVGPHVIHSWDVHDNPYAGIAGLLVRVPARIGSVRGSWSSSGLLEMNAWARHLCLYSAPMIVVNAGSIAHELNEHGVDETRLVIMRNVLTDLDAFEPLPRQAVLAELGMNAEDRFVVIVGNLRAVKNHLMFVEAMARVASRVPDVRGVIVGEAVPSEPEWAAVLRARVQELGLERQIIFAGFRADVSRLLPHAAAACLTSDQEGSPNVIVEAMAAGTPVVATNVGGIPELVTDGVSGLLVEPGDAAAMAVALSRVLTDGDLASRLGTAGQSLALMRHDPSRTSSRLAALYLSGLA